MKTQISNHCWTRSFDAAPPNPYVHTFSRPPASEIIHLLPIAYRLSKYSAKERSEGREPIFDLSGIALQPPNPGPHAGVPLGGIGGGSIGRGFKGEFRRWSLYPGRYIHREVIADTFSIRVKRSNRVYTTVLSTQKPDMRNSNKYLRDWGWNMNPGCATYYAKFPYSWTAFDNPVPGIQVFIKQISPFIPHNYGDSSLPVGVFVVEVENTDVTEAEVSIMFSFQNGYKSAEDSNGGFLHSDFTIMNDDMDSIMMSGVCMQHSSNQREQATNQGSFSIVAISDAATEMSFSTDHAKIKITTSTQFDIEKKENKLFSFEGLCANTSDIEDSASNQYTAESVWNQFTDTGDIKSGKSVNISTTGVAVGAAVCIRKTLKSQEKQNFTFSLAWDNPYVTFGEEMQVPRYYTRFFGRSGLSSPHIAAYSLLHYKEWEHLIDHWQHETIKKSIDFETRIHCQSGSTLGSNIEGSYYCSQLFNELYFLVDGGTIWTDTKNGVDNGDDNPIFEYKSYANPTVNTTSSTHETEHASLLSEKSIPLMNGYPAGGMSIDYVRDYLANTLSIKYLNKVKEKMASNTERVRFSNGSQDAVGQFLYLEGHEYYMYNTYDVHFYSSYALIMLWPQLELSLQRDFSNAVPLEDLSTRLMIGTGNRRPRKVKNVVPHDLGSPCGQRWRTVNAYNFQDVSRWKDLGSKFILQVYRDFYYLWKNAPVGCSSEGISTHCLNDVRQGCLEFLKEVYPNMLAVMESTREFDKDGDGMIENEGFPDQTYDIWVAQGVHAYCGGLWIAACEAMATMACIVDDAETCQVYTLLADKSRMVYQQKLWNGQYLNYDESNSSHHDSIMADMLAGQWYAHACGLTPIIDPSKAMSCYQTIYKYNVEIFGDGKFLGAVNGMKPDGKIDMSCMQSREVWTGTTYGLASLMLLAANFYGFSEPVETLDQNDVEVSEKVQSIIESKVEENDLLKVEDILNRRAKERYNLLYPSTMITNDQRIKLLKMSHNTARGIHDGGWQEFGYWFATPEGWEKNGNYRSLGYMRALCIWALQYSAEM